MATGTFYITVGSSDGMLYDSTSYINHANYARIGRFSGGYKTYLKFSSITIPAGALITNAYIKFRAYDSNSEVTVNLNIYANDTVTPVTPGTAAAVNDLSLTSAVGWNAVAAWSAMTWYESPDISSLIQYIIDKTGWASGNNIAFLINNNGSSVAAFRDFYTYELDPAYAAQLVVEYEYYGLLEDGSADDAIIAYGPESVSESASVNEEILEITQNGLDEEVSSSEDIDVTHLQPYHGILDEEAAVTDSFDPSDPAEINEQTSVSDSYELNDVEISEEVYANDDFEISPFEYTLDVTETGWAIDDFDVPNHGELDENVSSDDSIYSLLDGLDESASSDEMFSFVYELDISEDASADDDNHLLLVESLDETVDINETVNRWLGLPITETFSANDTPQPGWNLSAATTGALTSTASNIWGIPISEWLAMLDAPTNLWDGVETITDAFVAQDTIERVEYLLEALTEADLSESVNGWLYILLSEVLAVKDAATGNLNLDLSATTTGDLESEVLQHLHFAVATEMDLSGLSRVALITAIESAVDAAGTLTGEYTFAGVVETLVALTDFAGRAFDLTATTEGDFSSTAQAHLLLQILEALHAVDTASPTGVFNHTATTTAVLGDTVRAHFLLSALSEMGFDSLATLIAVPDEAILSGLELADTLESMGAFGLSVTTLADLAETARPALQFLATSTLAAASAAVLKQWMIDSVTSSVAAASTATDTLYTYPSISESLMLVGTAAANGTYYNTVQSALRLSIVVVVDGETWECYVLNTPKFAPSIYTGFDFNSYAVFENRAYGANSDGIYELTGTTDAGDDIQAAAILSETDFDIGDKKRFRKAYLGVSGSSPVMIMESDDGLRRVYTIDDKGQVNATRELTGKEWTLTVSDFDRLDYIRLVPVLLARGR